MAKGWDALHNAPMDGLAEFGQPQQLAGLVAVGLLGLALTIESLMLWAGLRRLRTPLAEEPLAVAEPAGHDFYDWLYE